PEHHQPASAGKPPWALGYLGTYSADRQPVLDALLCQPARLWPEARFAVAGPLYPADLEWPANVERIEHVGPDRHAWFYGRQRFTLNVTRADMVRWGYSPSVRLFEAAACGVPIISDEWPGLATIFAPDQEILVARGSGDVLRYLAMGEAERLQLAVNARRRVLASHTAAHRAALLESYVEEALAPTSGRKRAGRAALSNSRAWDEVRLVARRELADADAAMVTSYCPDGIEATELVLEAPGQHVFYDLDTPVTLARLAAGEPLEAIGPRRLAPFDLVLSYTGGGALTALTERLGARRVAPLYGSVDPERYQPATPPSEPRAALSYLGTYAADRQDAVDRLLLEPARQRSDLRFVVGGAQYPQDFAWTDNIFFWRHVAPGDHPRF